MVAVAGFSLIIYYWAIFTRLPREEMMELVAKQSAAPDDLPPAPRH
jgi:hypothetical protein